MDSFADSGANNGFERMKTSHESFVIAFAPKQCSEVGDSLLVGPIDWSVDVKLTAWIVTIMLRARAKLTRKSLTPVILILGT
jgi:hypothetical protein